MNQFDIAYNKDLINDFDYRLLSRLQSDCKYYLGQGNKCEKYLWAGNAVDQIKKMKELYDKLPVKPEWCTYDDILEYEKLMCTPVTDTITEDLFSSEDLALIVEHCQLINESFGKWAKNVFTKFGKGAVEKELIKTFHQFIKKYQFKRYKDEKPNSFAKVQDQYVLLIDFKLHNYKKAYIYLTLKTKKQLKQVQGFNRVEIIFKHSYTVEDMANALNKELNTISLNLTESASALPKALTGDTSAEKTTDKQIQSNSEEKLRKVADATGFTPETFKEKLSDVEGDNAHKVSMIRSLITGWKKLTENERKIFQQLQN